MAYHDILQTFIEKERKSTGVAVEKVPRVRAAELILRYACGELYGNDGIDSEHDETRPDKEGDSELLRLILGQPAYLEAVDDENRNIVSWAAQGGNLREMTRLCKEKLNFTLPDTNKRTPLHWAAESGNPAVVKCLLDKSDVIDPIDSSGQTPLLKAAAKGNFKVMELLLGKKAARDHVDVKSRTALHLAAKGGHDHCVRLLLEKGGKPDAADQKRRTPLTLAAKGGHHDCVQLLLQKGAKPDSVDDHRRTPLSWAAERGHFEVVETLLLRRDPGQKAKTNHSIRDRKRQGVGGAAGTKTGAGKRDELDDSYRKSENRGGAEDGSTCVEVDSKDVNGQTPLWYAATNYHSRIFDALCASGAKPSNSEGLQGHLASMLGEVDLTPQKREVLNVMLKKTKVFSGIMDLITVRGSRNCQQRGCGVQGNCRVLSCKRSARDRAHNAICGLIIGRAQPSQQILRQGYKLCVDASSC